jgi:hypothetical protein
MKEGGRYIAGTITAIDEIPIENMGSGLLI